LVVIAAAGERLKGMFTVRKPSEELVSDYLARQVEQPLSYDAVGCTREERPAMPGWKVDRNRVRLGTGREVFVAAKRAISRWAMFPREVASICDPDQTPQQDLVVGVIYRCAAAGVDSVSGESGGWMNQGDSALPTARYPIIRSAARSDLWSSGARRTIRFGTTCSRCRGQRIG
jgi:hypothetical protein